MKVAVIYHSLTGNTRKQAELVAEGARSVNGIEVMTMSIDDSDNAWIEESKAVIFGCPTYEGSCSWQMKRYLDNPSVKFSGKLAGFFASQNWPGGGGADFAEMTMIAAALVLGMLVFLTKVKSTKKLKHGFIFWNMVWMLGIGRFLINFFRDDPRFLTLSEGQYLGLVMFIISIIVLWKYYKKDVKQVLK